MLFFGLALLIPKVHSDMLNSKNHSGSVNLILEHKSQDQTIGSDSILKKEKDNSVMSGVTVVAPEISTASHSLFNPQDCPAQLVEQISNAAPAEKITFHEQYLAKYFPRALVVRGRFLANMRPDEIDLALDDIVKIFKVEPGFYFSNDAERVKIWLYLEVVIGQFSLISEFLKKAFVDQQKQEIFLYNPLRFGIGSSRINCTFLRSYQKQESKKLQHKQLITYLHEKRLTAVDRFYATYFDYLKKIFNQAVLLQDVAQAQKYQRELKFVIDKLQGTAFERMYQDPFNLGNELLTILQAQIAMDHEDLDDDDDYGDDAPRRVHHG
jgi:hypothetical protein